MTLSQTTRHADASSENTQSSNFSSRDLETHKIDPNTHRPPLWKRKRLRIVMLAILALLALLLGLSLGLTLDHNNGKCNATCSRKYPVVDLGYAQYQGTVFPGGIKQFLGMRYAAPPVGDLRFAAPRDPKLEKSIIKANKIMPHCLGTKPKISNTRLVPSASEDCLFIDLYGPANTTGASKLPVYFFIQGGGFNGQGSSFNASALIEASGMNMLVVQLTYRVGPYGFLASKEIVAGGSLNNGLKDQRKALHWVQDHIAKFGGDPARVTMGGASAGAASVTLQVAAYGGRDDKLFRQTAAESQSFGAIRTVAESQYQYDALVKRTKCAKSQTGSSDTLACLRKLDINVLQHQNINTPFPGQDRKPLFPYNPTLDHDFLTDVTIALYDQGKFVNVPAIYGNPSDEGTIFVPRTTDTKQLSNQFLTANFPKLSPEMLDTIQKLYTPEKFRVKPEWKAGPYWRSTSCAYGDLRYVCPGFRLSDQYAKHFPGTKVWNYHYNVGDPASIANGIGVPHVAETSAIWALAGAPKSYRVGGINHDAIRVMQGYWSSFIRFGDPNVARAAGTPLWEEWGGPTVQKRLRINDGGKGVMESNGPELKDRCQALGRWGIDIAQR